MFAMGKRIFLFIALNALIMITLSVLTSVLGIRPYMTAYGIDYEMLMAFCLVWGMGGAFISLALSRLMAKMMMGVKVIDPSQVHGGEAQWLLETVHALARSAGISTMPEVGIYESMEVNAFATGPTKNRALVAVSRGLLSRMNRSQIEGVLGHEVAHVANGDMVTMTLVQGVVNAFVMFLARALAFAIAQALSSRREDDREGSSMSPMVYHLVQFALQGLQRTFETVDTEAQPAVQSMKISSRKGGFLHLFSTHPSLEDRIARLETATNL